MSVSQILAGRFFKEETIFEVEVYAQQDSAHSFQLRGAWESVMIRQ